MYSRHFLSIAVLLLGAVFADAQPPALWQSNKPLPKSTQAALLKDVAFHVIKKWEPQQDGYRWLHGLALSWHKGKLYASFGHNKGKENTLTEEARYCVSADGGKTWSRPRAIDTGTDSKDLAVSHGVFVSHGGRLWAFLGAFHGTRKRVHTRAYELNESSNQWEARGVVVARGFWPMTQPIKMDDGNWIMSGLRAVDRFNDGKNQAAVAISSGNDFTKWKLVVIPNKAPGRMWGESSVVVRGKRILNISRYQEQARALVAESRDFGRTWSASSISNLAMVTSKPYSGTLSTGQNYLIATTTADSGRRRYPLTIAVSAPNATEFSKVFIIRRAKFDDGPGESHIRASLAYPYAVERKGRLYVAYSNSGGRGGNYNSAELAVIPLDSLK